MPNDAEQPPSTISTRGCDSSNAAAIEALTRRLISGGKKRRASAPKFPISERTNAFRKRFFAHATLAEWNDWQWQVRNRIRSLDSLSRILNLSEDERSAIERHTGSLPVGITPYYLSLFDRDDAQACRKARIDLLVQLGPLAPPFASLTPFIMPIYDLNHRLQPDFPELKTQIPWRVYLYTNACRYATFVLVDSKEGKEDVLQLYGQIGRAHV